MTEKKDEKFSYSKLSMYESCPFKYKLQYVDGNFIYTGSVATEFGSAIHETEEAIAKAIRAKEPVNYIKLKNELIVKFAEIEHKYPGEYLLDDGKSNRNYRDKAYEYLEKDIYHLEKFMKEHPSYEIVGIEQKFNFTYDQQHYFTGAIDRVFRDTETDQYLIQDIKSWAVQEDEDELKTPLQFVVYTLAAKELWGAEPEKITCQYYLPLVNCSTQNGGTKGYIDRGIKKLNRLFDGIKASEFAPKQTPLCNYCNFCRTNPTAPEKSKYLCPYYSLWDRSTRNKFDIVKHENEWQGLDQHQAILESFHKKYGIAIQTKNAENN